MIAYIWVWAGFAMVVIAAGLSAIPRDVLEAARTDGASEWRVFRRVTAPLLAPVLSVVFITMLINVLKVFDIVLAVAPASVQDDANVIALAMWRTSFGGVNDFGLGSRDRRLPVPARDPDPGPEHPPIPKGGLTRWPPSPKSCRTSRPASRSPAAILRFLGRAPLNILLAVVAVLWLVPTIGLLVTSLLPADQFNSHGWWEVFSDPSQLTWENYSALFDNGAITDSLVTTLEIAIGGTVLPVIVAALAGYAFAWLEFPGRDWFFIGVIALLVVPLQMALIPMFKIYNSVGIFDTVLSLVLFHTAFGLPFAIFLLRNFFVGIPKDIIESARIDGASEMRHLRPADAAARAAGDRVARRSSSSCGRGTTCSSASRSAGRRSRSRSRSSRRCASSARTSRSSRRPRSSRWWCRWSSSSPSSATSWRASWPARSSRRRPAPRCR